MNGTVASNVLENGRVVAVRVTFPPETRGSLDLFNAWESYIKALASQLNEEQNRLLKNQIVGFAKMVAAAAGGFLGIGKVSATEEKALAKIEKAFDR